MGDRCSHTASATVMLMMVSNSRGAKRPWRAWRRRLWQVRSIQVNIAMRGWSQVVQVRLSRTFFCSRAKNDSMAALPPLEPARPIDLMIR